MSPSAERALAVLHPAVRAWFTQNFAAPSPPQLLGWPPIAAGKNVLILAPTGSGKTLAAFLQCLGRLYAEREAGIPMEGGVRVLYVSPLKALNNDIHRNLLAPLEGIAREAARLGLDPAPLRAAVRTGDTPPAERRRMAKEPPAILITTPESLSLLLCSAARDILRTAEVVIVDELHALYPNKRGVHLAVSLEHLASLAGRPLQRLGLSATVHPAEEAASFLAGGEIGGDGSRRPRPVEIIDTGQRKTLDLGLILPVEDLADLPEKTIWPAVERELLELIHAHRSTLVFVNNRRLAERLTAALNERAGKAVARAHHGSLARETRLEVEELLKEGHLPCLVATSSLELGIDVGAIELVVQIESPKEVARGLQRVGRAGHLLHLPSKGRIIPKTRDDLLECALVIREMRAGRVEAACTPRNCLDVLAQQIVALASMEEKDEEDLYRTIRRAHPYRDLGREQFERVLAMLAGADDEGRFLGLRPKIFWDRTNRLVRAADRGRRLLYTNGGTIPDRGCFGVYLAGTGVRLGELDEEFVFERRIGERFVLGTNAWRIEEIRRDRVLVGPAGRSGALVPFWRGETAGRSFELGRRMGEFLEELEARLDGGDLEAWLARECLLNPNAARNLREYLRAQRQAAGLLPSHRRVVVEEYRDELGEWRIMLHAPFGGRVNLGLALLLREGIRARDGFELEFLHGDDGILFQAPGGEEPPSLELSSLPAAGLPEKLGTLLRGLPVFAAAFRENAARALLLPAGGGRGRTPLWLARLRAADLLQVVSDRPDFPLVLETMRDCLERLLDLRGLEEVAAGLGTGAIMVHRCRTSRPSPFARALAFRFLGLYMYVPDLPKGERHFHAFGLDTASLRELLGREGLRRLLDPEAVAAVDAEARGEAVRLRPQNADELHAWLREGRELAEGFPEEWSTWLEELKSAGRAALLAWPGKDGAFRAWVAAEDAPLYLAAVPGARLLWPEKQTAPAADPREARRRLVRRFAGTHGPFLLQELACRYNLPAGEAAAELAGLEAEGIVASGEFSPGRSGTEWCGLEFLRRIHRLSLAKARREIEPRGPADYALFLARRHGLIDAVHPRTLQEVLAGLAGVFLPARAWDGGILPLRLPAYRPADLDRIVTTGQFSWRARGRRAGMELAFAVPGGAHPGGMASPPSLTPAAAGIKELLRQRGASFLVQLVQWSDLAPEVVLAALEELVAAGLAANDTLGPVRYFTSLSAGKTRYRLTQRILAEMGRWALVEECPPPRPEDLAWRLLSRHGIACREHARQEGTAWEDLLPVYDRWEAAGRIRRGYFVEGLAGTQYSLPEAVEELRRPAGDAPEYWAMLRCDPANPYGAVLPLPAAGIEPEMLVLRRGEPVLAAGGKRIRIAPLAALQAEDLQRALAALMKLLECRGRVRVTEFAGRPVLETEAAAILAGMGFERVYREMVKWA